ncbi:MAG: hypothetical protein SWZ49_21810 [Cyanobacteriota bacterium]|nr:hypothetical protein [Cyanobacteriota bacterium]
MTLVTRNIQSVSVTQQQELQRYLNWQLQQIAPDASEIKIKPEITKTEIDSVPDIFGTLYRVWDGMILLGTFYENQDGRWVVKSCNREDILIVGTSLQAHIAVVASYLDS